MSITLYETLLQSLNRTVKASPRLEGLDQAQRLVHRPAHLQVVDRLLPQLALCQCSSSRVVVILGISFLLLSSGLIVTGCHVGNLTTVPAWQTGPERRAFCNKTSTRMT